MTPHGIVGVSFFSAARRNARYARESGLFVQMPRQPPWQYVNYCPRRLPCLSANILALVHIPRIPSRRYPLIRYANAASAVLAICNYCLRRLPCLSANILALAPIPRIPSRRCPLIRCANAASAALAICKLLPAPPSLPWRKYPRSRAHPSHLVAPLSLFFVYI